MEKLKKFLKNFELEVLDFLGLSERILSWIGFEFEYFYTPELSIKEKVKKILKISFYWFTVANLILAIISSGASIFSRPSNIDKITYGLPIVTSSLIIILKAFVLFFNRSDILEILKAVKSFNQRENALNSEMFRKFVYGYLISLMSTTLVNITTPILKIIFTGQKTFPLAMKFPFDATNDFIYPLALIWTFFNLVTGLLIFLATDVLIYGLIYIISAQFHALKDDFKKLNLKEQNNDINRLILHHNELYDVCLQLEKIFTLSFFYKFIISSFVICFTAFQCSTASDLPKLMTNVTICIANFNQIGLQCFFGQMLTNASEIVTEGIYDCEWENSTSIKLRKSLMICLARSQNHVALTTLKFGEITYEQFTYVSLYENLLFKLFKGHLNVCILKFIGVKIKVCGILGERLFGF